MGQVLWDPEVLARVRHLAIRARMAVRGVLQGAHPSRSLGGGADFADYKAYSPGDSLRDLDWRVLARSDRLVVRRHRAEADLPAMVVMDASGDMATGTTGSGADAPRPPLDGSKFGVAVCLAATLAYYLFLHGEPVGLAVLGGDAGVPKGGGLPLSVKGAGRATLAPRGGRQQLARIFATLADLRPQGRASMGAALAELAPGLRRNSLLVLIGDLMEEVAEWSPALDGLGRRRVDLRVVHLHDAQEMDLRFTRPRLFFSPEGGDALPLDPMGARASFLEELGLYRGEVRAAILRQRGVYLSVSSDEAIAEVLLRLIAGHHSRVGAP